MLELLKGLLLAQHSLLNIKDLPDDVICVIAIYADDDTTQASDLWQQLEWASELEPDLWNTVGWGKKWLVDFNTGKTHLVSFDWSNNTGSFDMKMNGLFWSKNQAGVDLLN